MSKVVVGVDESDAAADALRWAVAHARLHGWPVTAVLAWSLLSEHPLTGDATPFDPGYDHTMAAEALETIVGRALGPDAASTIERIVVNHSPAEALLGVANDERLLVLGARGLGGFRGLLLGSVSRKCLHYARCPVAIVRSGARPPGDGRAGRIVVGVDGSSTSRVALDWALDEARVRRAALDVVHTWSLPFFVRARDVAPLDVASSEALGRDLVDAMLADADTDGLVEPPTVLLGTARAAAGFIVESAADADLVVVGSRGQGATRSTLLGSVSDQVARHARCPVVVVPPR